MKLTSFNEQTLPKSGAGAKAKPRVAFNKAGTISFNNAATALMGVNKGDKIAFSQNTDAPEDWYFHKDAAGYELRGGYKEKGALFNHIGLVKKFIEFLALDEDKTYGFGINLTAITIPGDKSKTQYWLIKTGIVQ